MLSGYFDILVKLYHIHPVFFILCVGFAIVSLPYKIVYRNGPKQPRHFGYNDPRKKLLMFCSILAVELAWVIFIAWRLRNS